MANSKPQFEALNTEDITSKPEPLQTLWGLLSKLDPKGELFVADKGIVAVAGQVEKDNPSRSMKSLKLTPPERELISSFAIYDGPEPDNQDEATGLIFTMYQMLELAFSLGVKWESARVDSAVLSASEDDSDPDADDPDDDPDAVSSDEEIGELEEDDEFSDDDDDDDDDA